MPLTGDDIAKIAAIPGVLRIRITADGTIIINKTEVAGAEVAADTKRMGRPRVSSPKSGADRARQFRQRRVTKSLGLVTKSPDAAPLFEPETVTESPEPVTKSPDAVSVTQSQVPPPPSPPPSPPTPSPSAPAAPTPPKGKRLRDEATGFAEACRVVLDLTASPRLQAAWAEWQQYRQRRHNQTGNDKLEWSLQAARLTANQVVRYAEAHGEQIVIDRITTAIAGRWQGPNLDKLETPKPKPETREEIRSHYNPNRWDSTSPISPKTSSQG